MGSFSKLIYHIIFVTRYRRKTKLNLFANTDQKEHHRIKSFEEEHVELLQRHAIEFERRYLFEGESS